MRFNPCCAATHHFRAVVPASVAPSEPVGSTHIAIPPAVQLASSKIAATPHGRPGSCHLPAASTEYFETFAPQNVEQPQRGTARALLADLPFLDRRHAGIQQRGEDRLTH